VLIKPEETDTYEKIRQRKAQDIIREDSEGKKASTWSHLDARRGNRTASSEQGGAELVTTRNPRHLLPIRSREMGRTGVSVVISQTRGGRSRAGTTPGGRNGKASRCRSQIGKQLHCEPRASGGDTTDIPLRR